MVLPGHLAGGYLVTTALLYLVQPNFSQSEIITIFILGTIAGELPDIDLFFFNIKYKKINTETLASSKVTDSHRNYVTHVPLFWFGISLLIWIFGFVIGSEYIEFISYILLAGTWSHFLLDSIEYGIRWLAPWSNKRFALKLTAPEKPAEDRPGSLLQYFHFLIRTYWRMTTFWLEILITTVALLVFLSHLY